MNFHKQGFYKSTNFIDLYERWRTSINRIDRTSNPTVAGSSPAWRANEKIEESGG